MNIDTAIAIVEERKRQAAEVERAAVDEAEVMRLLNAGFRRELHRFEQQLMREERAFMARLFWEGRHSSRRVRG